MRISDIMRSIGNILGVNGRDDQGNDAGDSFYEGEDPQYQGYQDQGQMQYEDEPAPRSGYGMGGTTYIRGGVQPQQASAPRQQQQQQQGSVFSGILDRIRGKQPQEEYYDPQPQPTPRSQPRSQPDNVLQMPRQHQGDDMYDAQPEREQQQNPTVIYCVRRKEDSEQIISYLMQNVSVILNLEEIDDNQRIRVLDLVGGAAFVLGANVERISHRTYFVTPSGVMYVSGADRTENNRYEQRVDRPYAVR